MSDSQAYEEVAVTSDGVAVVKRFEEDEFPVPAIAFEFESEREESVTVTMTDSVPDGIEVEDLGFHPEYGSEFWTIDDDTITFERELGAGESYTTVYGIRATGSDDVSQFLTEPALESVDPPLPEDEQSGVEDIVPETDDNVVKDAISGDGEIPGLEDEPDEQAEEEDIGTLELNDPNSDRAGGDAGGEAGTDATISVDGASLTAALANEIRQQNVSGEDLKLLRRALDMAAENEGATRAKIDQIQNDLADLRAYTGALEEFLDENGTGEELIEEFEAELESFDDRLGSIQSDLSANRDELDSMADTVSTVDEEVDSLGADVESVSGEMESVRSEVDSVSSQLDTLDASIEELETTVESLEEQVSDGDVMERLDEIDESIEDLQSWQTQIKETFGG